MAGLPLDVAADAGDLGSGDRLSRQDGVQGGAQIPAGDRDAITGPAGIKLAAINQTAATVKKEEIRGAGRLVGTRHRLRLVVEVRELEAEAAAELRAEARMS